MPRQDSVGPEINSLHALLSPSTCYDCCSCSATWDSGWACSPAACNVARYPKEMQAQSSRLGQERIAALSADDISASHRPGYTTKTVIPKSGMENRPVIGIHSRTVLEYDGHLGARWTRKSRHDLWDGSETLDQAADCTYAPSGPWWVQRWPPYLGS